MRLVWALQAELDLYEIVDHYADITPELSDQILDRIVEAPRMLTDHPHLGRAIGALGLRKWAVRKTPFILLYRVTPDAVEIARVVAAASDWMEE